MVRAWSCLCHDLMRIQAETTPAHGCIPSLTLLRILRSLKFHHQAHSLLTPQS